MTATGAVISALVGVTVLLGGGWRLIKAYHRWASAQERQADATEALTGKVNSLELTLNNGIRTDVREARTLAAEAARKVSLTDQRAEEGRTEIARAVNALRAEVDVMTNVVLTDRRGVRAALRDAGIEIPDDDE